MFRDELIRTLAGVAGQESVRCAFPFGCEGYHISQHHGPRGVRIAVTAQNLQNLLQLSVRNEDGVEAHQTVNDDTAILELEGVVVFTGVKPNLYLDSGCVVILLSRQVKFTVVEVLVPRDASYHVCNDLQPGDTLPTILPLEVACRLAETFITRNAVLRQAVRMGIPLVPDNMMTVPKRPVADKPVVAPMAEPPKVGKKTAKKRPAKKHGRKVKHQMKPATKPARRINKKPAKKPRE